MPIMHKSLPFLLIAVWLCACNHAPVATPYPDWQNKDLKADGIFGISTDKAFDQLLKNKKPKTVIVAVIDSGIDTTREGLKNNLWTDPATRAHGRNYLLAETGKEDFIPMLAKGPDSPGYYSTLADFTLHLNNFVTYLNELEQSEMTLDQIDRQMGKLQPKLEDFKAYKPRNVSERILVQMIIERLPEYPDYATMREQELSRPKDLALDHGRLGLSSDYAYSLEPAQFNARLNDWPPAFDNKISNDPPGLTTHPNDNPTHGTYISGIIASGALHHVQIMMLKVFNNIREARDAYEAEAIRYAADHGASIINLSVGKTFSLQKDRVDEAVKYAMSKDVLIVHSAGNNGVDLDVDSNKFFPSPSYLQGGIADAWLTVGASGFRDDSTLMASFSNYGKNKVDVFAPGVRITSLAPHGRTATWDGTSQSAAVVSGLAALIRAYYPHLTASQVKDIIMKSVVKKDVLRNKCQSGGVVNSYLALKSAEEYK